MLTAALRLDQRRTQVRGIYLVLILGFSYAWGSDAFKGIQRQGRGTVSGVLNTESVPYRLFINHGLQNQEVIFLRHLKARDALIYKGAAVTVTGKVDIFQKRQYMLLVESIRPATAAELRVYKR